jgi:hypothetical protein
MKEQSIDEEDYLSCPECGAILEAFIPVCYCELCNCLQSKCLCGKCLLGNNCKKDCFRGIL